MVRRIDFKRLADVGDGLLFVAFLVIGDAPVDVGGDIFGVERDDLGVVGDGVVNVAFTVVGDPPVVVGVGRVSAIVFTSCLRVPRTQRGRCGRGRAV